MSNKVKVVRVIFLIICMIVLLFFLTGCGNDEVSNNNDVQNNDNPTKQSLSIDRAMDFDGDIAVVTQTVNMMGTHYVIDREFNVLYSYKGNSTYLDGYMQIPVEEEKKTNIVDKNGNVVFSYGDYEYEKVELVDNGCIITTKQNDTYNSSNTLTGVYSLADQKYLIEPSETYVGKIRPYGDDMLLLNDEGTEFFNLKTKSIVKYSERVPEEFKDGYSVVDDNSNYKVWYLKVFDDNGNIKKIAAPYDEIVYGDENQNGMVFEITSYVYRNESGNERVRTYCSIFNLAEGTAKDLSNEFWIVENKPHYTKEGYALVNFTNQGGTPYYTVIDKQGNMLFEPQKVNDNSTFAADDNGEERKIISTDLSEDGYFIVTDNGVYKVVDKNNNVVLTAEDNEIFDGVTNNTVKVHWKKQGYYEQFYYKDLEGNRIGLNIEA